MTARRGAAALALAALALASPLVMKWEGKRNATYIDLAGIPTACYGQTGARVKTGQRYSDETCKQWLQESMAEHYAGLTRCLTAPAEAHQLAALTSWTYNVGVSAACKSQLVRKANAGDWPGACAELDKWVFVKGQRVQGLVNRRKEERALCEGRMRSLPADLQPAAVAELR
ncbi:lysozyme [Chitinilyticum litopenaei]|uniref:lysozyme n=1 Tax=Chitinilyticum litopenaei TaxID=1121276 RepID=UPI0004241D19|nr:lysozyme [Chitinilyticum litopenaei]